MRGVRYDHVTTNIHSYNDWFKTPINATDSVYKQRSQDLHRSFNSLTWSAGINYATGQLDSESKHREELPCTYSEGLGTDGINYHIFRYEKG